MRPNELGTDLDGAPSCRDPDSNSPRRNSPRAHANVGRMLRTLRLGGLLSVDAAALASGVAPRRLRELEAGRDLPDYLEALDLMKPYLLCSPCLARHLRAAAAHDGAVEAASAALLAVLAAPDTEDDQLEAKAGPASSSDAA